MSTWQARYHAFGALASLSLAASGMAGMLLPTATPAPLPASPCGIVTVTPSPSASPVTSVSPGASPTDSGAGPSPSASTSPAPGQLCVRVQALSGSPVTPGHNARYAIWVWFAGSATGDAMVGVTATPGTLSPTFTVCPWPGTAICPVAASGQPVELVAQVKAPQHHAGASLMLTATGVSPQAAVPASAWASVKIKGPAKPKPKPTSTRTSPAPATSTPASVGVTVPPTLPPLTLPPTSPPATLASATPPAGVLPSVSLPVLPDPAASPDPFTPAATPGSSPGAPIRVTDASAQFPLSARQSGSQLAGLAALAVAVTLAVARLSLRKPRPPKKQDGAPASE